MELTEFLLARIAEDEAGHDRMTEALRTEGLPDVAWKARAECDAKRRIVEHYEANNGPYLVEDVLRLLALPYADHPDFREEWRP